MQYDVSTPSEYLAALEEDWRKEKLLEVRSMIMKDGPELQESIEYKMLCYGDDKKNIFHLNAQKNFVGLYVGDLQKIPGAKEELADFDLGKGCVRIRRSIKLQETQLQKFVQQVITIWREGGDTGC